MSRYPTYRILFITLILIAASIASVFLYQAGLYFCLLFTGILMLVLVYYLCFLQSSNFKLIERLVDSLRYNDFTLSFSTKGKSATESKLRNDMNEVVLNYRKELTAHQERYKYYETLLDTVDSYLLVADDKGNVQWMNKAAQQDLCGHAIHSVDALNEINPNFTQQLAKLHAGEVKVIKLFKEEVTQELAVSMTEYTTEGFRYRLYCFTNVRSLLEENEMEAWQKLVRVLTHEMMNSIAPIISLSETLAERVEQDNRGEQLDEMIVHGMKVIHRRSKGLLEFVENYRKLSRLSMPLLAYIKVGDLLDDIKKLFHNPKIDYRYDIEEKEQLLFIDRSQIEQVLINLLKNAEEACAEQPNPVVKITTSYLKEKHLLLISVSDNGCGILPDVQEKIFVPFFTTKQKGSGIGLSLCKQIMSLHGGSISVKSEEGVGSTFTLKFVCR